ncbi:MAG TPA: hypothetical protein VLA56_06470 [Pseudomonadales bacterium]|nr:hypothetical protein [Pseudomonadales bacterium]
MAALAAAGAQAAPTAAGPAPDLLASVLQVAARAPALLDAVPVPDTAAVPAHRSRQLAAAAAGSAITTPPPRLQDEGDTPRAAPSLVSGDRSELHLDLGVQARLFPRTGTLGQDRFQPSLAARIEYFRDWNDGRDAITVAAFLRADAMDSRRTHADLREAYYSHIGDDWELHVGARRVFWGKAESRHLVDVINQVDLIEDLDEEDRLGQPMVQLVLLRDFGTIELFLLPGARQRTFPSRDGRLAGPVSIDDDARFTGGANALETSWAARWSHFIGDLEIGVAHFSGTAREPAFEVVGPVVPGVPVRLRPVYETVARTSLDAQYILGDTALKLELLDRRGQGPRATAFIAGFEHTLVGAFGGRTDLGLLMEYLHDGRGDRAPVLAFEHDLFVGARLAFNDPAGSQLLAGVIRDLHTDERIFTVEGSRRLGGAWRLAVDLRVFTGVAATQAGDVAALSDPDRKLGLLVDDDYLQIELTRYF